MRVRGSMRYAMTNPATFTWIGDAANRSTLAMVGGTPGAYATLEVAGEDMGDVAAGWTANFQLDRLLIGPGAQVLLADALDNGNRGGTAGSAEALYVSTLELAAGARLDLNCLHDYYDTLIQDPTAQILEGAGCAEVCIGDIDGDGAVSLGDLSRLLSCYGACAGDAEFNAAADLDGNGCIAFEDLALGLANFGSVCP